MTRVVIFALLMAGCSQDTVRGGGGSGGAGGSGGGHGSPCSVDQREDAFGNCLETCLTPTDCPTNTRCHPATGLCLPESQDDCDPANCQLGWVCPSSGFGPCEPGDGFCETLLDCPLGDRCDAGRCVPAVGDLVQTCNTTADCGPLMTCQLGICFGCADDLQCAQFGNDARCVAGTCIIADIGPGAACLTLECPEGTRCNPGTGTCVTACDANDDCGTSEICAPVLGQCVTDPTCSGDLDCPNGLSCLAGPSGGLCVGCNEQLACAAGLTCVLGTCLPDLGTSPCDGVTCSPGDACDPLDGNCYRADGSCANSADCRPGQSCNFFNLCSGCSGNGDCRPGLRCIFGTCAPL